MDFWSTVKLWISIAVLVRAASAAAAMGAPVHSLAPLGPVLQRPLALELVVPAQIFRVWS